MTRARVPVQDEAVKGKCKSGRIRCFPGDESNPYDVFHYTPDRTRAGPQNFLADYKGHLQAADAYGGYDGIYMRGNVVEVARMAHARRKFFDAKEADGRRSAQMPRSAQRLYAIEDRIELRIGRRSEKNPGLTMDQRHEITREAASGPPRADPEPGEELARHRAKPGSAQEPHRRGHHLHAQPVDRPVRLRDGGLPEHRQPRGGTRALERVAIGRRNWLFAGNDAAGKSHANPYTLLASAQRHGLDPQKYLTSVPSKIGQTPMSELDQFLPDKWKAEDHAEPLLAFAAPASVNS